MKQSTHRIYRDTLDTLPQVITNTYSRRRVERQHH